MNIFRNNIASDVMTLGVWIDTGVVTLFGYDENHSLTSTKDRRFEEAWNTPGSRLWFPKLKPSMENANSGSLWTGWKGSGKHIRLFGEGWYKRPSVDSASPCTLCVSLLRGKEDETWDESVLKQREIEIKIQQNIPNLFLQQESFHYAAEWFLASLSSCRSAARGCCWMVPKRSLLWSCWNAALDAEQ